MNPTQATIRTMLKELSEVLLAGLEATEPGNDSSSTSSDSTQASLSSSSSSPISSQSIIPELGWSSRVPNIGARVFEIPRGESAGPILTESQSGDWILFERGGTWPSFSVKSGVTVGVYGSGDRPVMRPDSSGHGMVVNASARIFDLDIQGAGGNSGIKLGSNSLAEGCRTQNWQYGFDVRSATNARLYRCCILDSVKEGAWVTDTIDFVVEQCVIDRVSIEHGVYSSHNTGTQYLNNLFSNVAMYALKLRAGGASVGVKVIGNYIYNCIDPIQVNNEDPTHPEYEHLNLLIEGNIIDRAKDHWGMQIKEVTGLTIKNNKLVRDLTRYYHGGIDLQGRISGPVLIESNEFDGLSTSQCVLWRCTTPADGSVVVKNNLFQTQAVPVNKGLENANTFNNRFGPETVEVDLMTPATLAIMRDRCYGNWTVGSWEL